MKIDLAKIGETGEDISNIDIFRQQYKEFRRPEAIKGTSKEVEVLYYTEEQNKDMREIIKERWEKVMAE